MKRRRGKCKPTAIVRYWEGASFQINWHPIYSGFGVYQQNPKLI